MCVGNVLHNKCQILVRLFIIRSVSNKSMSLVEQIFASQQTMVYPEQFITFALAIRTK